MFSRSFTPLDLGLLVVVIPSLILYCMFLYLIFKNRNKHPFNSSFYRICMFLGVVDCLQLAVAYAIEKPLLWAAPLPHVRWIVQGGGHWLAPKVHAVFAFAFRWCQHLGVTTLAVNRCYAVLQPTTIDTVGDDDDDDDDDDD